MTHIEQATDEDKAYGIDRWARLFKSTTWEAVMQEWAAERQALTAKNQAMAAEIERLRAQQAEYEKK